MLTKPDSLWEAIFFKYWDIVPYNWRPMEIWYRIKCFCWKRYTTVKSRHLSHQWCDKTELIPYTLFEMLEDFVEKECSPGHIEWYGQYGHKVLVGMEYKYVRDEMTDLLKWWNEVYIPYTKGEHPEQIRLQELQKEYNDLWDKFWFPTDNKYLTAFDPEKALGPEKYQKYLAASKEQWKFEDEMEKELNAMCHRIINIRESLWT